MKTKNIFGKSKAAELLEDLVRDDHVLQAKVSSHLSDYFHYVNVIMKIDDIPVRVRALGMGLTCTLSVTDEVKRFIRNVKLAKLRSYLDDEGNKG